ncbi:HAD domain-containing protein [Chryseobacterium paludis]|uniref:HAD domain-containing protein n=1 Tax=Chryseobacterium paludis TaxID=2956784 RepID=UPI0021C080F8|nr:HAD domain-containing protein [Chryseobacterium paludis]
MEKYFPRRNIKFKEISIVDIPLNIKISRREEIEKWINDNEMDPDDLIIIDDDKSLHELPERLKWRWLQTDSYIGLINSRELINILEKDRK